MNINNNQESNRVYFTTVQGFAYEGQIWDLFTKAHRFGLMVPLRLYDQVRSAAARDMPPPVLGVRRRDETSYGEQIRGYVHGSHMDKITEGNKNNMKVIDLTKEENDHTIVIDGDQHKIPKNALLSRQVDTPMSDAMQFMNELMEISGDGNKHDTSKDIDTNKSDGKFSKNCSTRSLVGMEAKAYAAMQDESEDVSSASYDVEEADVVKVSRCLTWRQKR